MRGNGDLFIAALALPFIILALIIQDLTPWKAADRLFAWLDPAPPTEE